MLDARAPTWQRVSEMHSSHTSAYGRLKGTMEEILHRGCRDVNIVVLGPRGVGKSAVVVRYLTKRFIGDYDPLIESVYTHSTLIEGKQVTIHLRDTAWQDINMKESEEDIHWADGMVVVYSIVDKMSFYCAQKLVNRIQELRENEHTPIALIGNKCDLLHMRQVSEKEANEFCNENHLQFCEISAGDSFSSVYNAVNSLVCEVKSLHKKKDKLRWFVQVPSVASKLQIGQSLRNLADKRLHGRHRTSTL